MLYAITIMRFNDNLEQQTLVDRYITAEQAIEALIFAQGLAPIEEGEEDEEEQSDEQEEVEDSEEDEEQPEPKPKSVTGRRASYDKSEVEADIRAEVLSTKEIAEKYGVTTATVYQIRHAMKHADPVAVQDDEPPMTAYMQKQVGRAEVVTPDVNIEGEIKLAAIQGFSVSEIADMYPTVPMEKIAKLKKEAKR